MSSGDRTPLKGGDGAPWPRRGDPDGLSGEDGTPSLVVVFDEEEERSGTSWLPRGKAILLVAAAATAFLVIGSTSPGRGTGEVDSGGEAVVDPVPSSRPADGAPSSPARSDGEPVFVQRAEAVDSALARYRDRRRMYERGRLGCGPLENAHDSVDSSFLELALTFRDLRASLDSSSRARFDDLADRADEVDRHFDGSACRSPA
jgi:hypothetical protein